MHLFFELGKDNEIGVQLMLEHRNINASFSKNLNELSISHQNSTNQTSIFVLRIYITLNILNRLGPIK